MRDVGNFCPLCKKKPACLQLRHALHKPPSCCSLLSPFQKFFFCKKFSSAVARLMSWKSTAGRQYRLTAPASLTLRDRLRSHSSTFPELPRAHAIAASSVAMEVTVQTALSLRTAMVSTLGSPPDQPRPTRLNSWWSQRRRTNRCHSLSDRVDWQCDLGSLSESSLASFPQ